MLNCVTMKIHYILILSIIFIGKNSTAISKSTFSNTVIENDTVIIHLGEHTGNVQWQKSDNSINWSNVSEANSDSLVFIADQNAYFRAVVTAGDCEPYFSDTSEISVIPDLARLRTNIYSAASYIYGKYDLCMYKLCYSDLIKKGTSLADQPEFNKVVTLQSFNSTNNAISQIWDGYYLGLQLANKAIETIYYLNEHDEIPAQEGVNKSSLLGEAYFFRAYFHKCLVERWDNIILSVSSSDYKVGAELATKEQVYDLITADLDSAINLLPVASSIVNKTIASKEVAKHLLALTYLDLENWAEAAALATQIINSNSYALLPANQLKDVFSVQNQDNYEIIFSWLPESQYKQVCSPMLVPLYDRLNGVTRSWEGGGRPFARLLPSSYYWSLFDANDARLEAWHKRYWTYNTNETNDSLPDGVNIGDTVTEGNGVSSIGMDINLQIAPTITKYWEDSSLGRIISDASGFRNIIQYRYAQTLLIAAEAFYKLGNTATAQMYFDNLRTARGLANISISMDNIIDEQARELGMEGHRYTMLKRLGILYSRVNANPDWTDIFQTYHVRWPIPQHIIDLVPTIQQNIGY